MLLEQARLPQPVAEQAHKLAYQLADKLRNQKKTPGRAGMVQGYCRSFRCHRRRGADVSGGSAIVAYSRQSHLVTR